MNKEEFLFELYKDTTQTGDELKRAELQKKYPDVKISDLHRRIVNYQIEKYGYSLNNFGANRMDYKIRMMKIRNEKRRKKNGR